jgi:hypothetical protein
MVAGPGSEVVKTLDLVRAADLAGAEPDADADRRIAALEGRVRTLRPAREPARDPARRPASGPTRGLVLAAGPQDVQKLIVESALALGRTCLYEPVALSLVAPPPSLAERTELDAATVEPRVNQILYGCGLVLTPVDEARGLWEWIHASGPRRAEIVARTLFVDHGQVQALVALERHVSTLLGVSRDQMPAAFAKLRAAMKPGSAGLVFGQLDPSTLLLQGMARDVQAALDLVAPLRAGGADSRRSGPSAAATWGRLTALEAAVCRLERTPRPLASSRPTSVVGRRFMLEPGDHNLADLLRESDRFLRRTTAFDTEEVNLAQTTSGGPIRLQTLLELDELGCDVAVSQLLATRGLVLTPVDAKGRRRCTSTQQRPEPLAVSPDEVAASARRMHSIQTTLELERLPAQNATNQLRAFFASGPILQAKGARSIELTGPADQVLAVLRILKELDQPQPETRPSLGQRVAELEARVAALERGK